MANGEIIISVKEEKIQKSTEKTKQPYPMNMKSTKLPRKI
jgi:hypothetical protein